MTDSPMKTQLLTRLDRFPLLTRYLKSSLAQRLECDNWYENRVLRYIVRDSDWVSYLEKTFNDASLEAVVNSDCIFATLSGTQRDYDNQLFDALAEVRLIAWARESGYDDRIEKLKAESGIRTPDFLMTKGEEVVVGEAKHLRTWDYLLDFVVDRLEGLGIKMGRMNAFGLKVEAGVEYDRRRDNLVQENAAGRTRRMNDARKTITEECLASLERRLQSKPNVEIKIEVSGVPLSIKRYNSPGRVQLSQIHWDDPKKVQETLLLKLEGVLMSALKQIRSYLDSPYSRANPCRAVVFVAGMGPEEWDWDLLWEALYRWSEPSVWNSLSAIQQRAQSLLGVPFDLVTRQGDPPRYGLFPWCPEDCSAADTLILNSF